jgi:hypothetical protein
MKPRLGNILDIEIGLLAHSRHPLRFFIMRILELTLSMVSEDSFSEPIECSEICSIVIFRYISKSTSVASSPEIPLLCVVRFPRLIESFDISDHEPFVNTAGLFVLPVDYFFNSVEFTQVLIVGGVVHSQPFLFQN